MTIYIEKPAVNLREELASLRNQEGYQEQQFYFDGLVTNGTFDADTDWTLAAGASIAGGVLVFTTGATTQASQAIKLDPSKQYVVSLDVVRRDGGLSLRLTGGTTNNFESAIVATGTYSYSVTPNLGNDTLLLIGTNTSNDFDIDNVSVFELDANGDVIHRMPKGWVPKDVFEDGLLQREGSAHDYTVVYDGFDYYVKPTVAPSATTQTCVIGVKA